MPINIAAHAVHKNDPEVKKFFKEFFNFSGKRYTIVKESAKPDKSITYKEDSIKNALPLSIFKVALCFTLVVPLLAFLYQRIDAQKLKDYTFTQEGTQDNPLSPTTTKVEDQANRRLSAKLVTKDPPAVLLPAVLFDPKLITQDKVETAQLLLQTLNRNTFANMALTLFQQNKLKFEVRPIVNDGCEFYSQTKTVAVSPSFLEDFQKALKDGNFDWSKELHAIHEKVYVQINRGNEYVKNTAFLTEPEELNPVG